MQYVPVNGSKNAKKDVSEEDTSKTNSSNQEGSGTAATGKNKQQ